MGASGARRAKRAIAGPWVSVANISGTGTAIVESAIINLDFSTLPSFWEAVIELEFGAQVTAGTGVAYTWAKLEVGDALITTDATFPTTKYTYRTVVITNKRTRRIIINNDVVMSVLHTGEDRLTAYLRINGSAADTEFTASNIRARIVYLPI